MLVEDYLISSVGVKPTVEQPRKETERDETGLLLCFRAFRRPKEPAVQNDEDDSRGCRRTGLRYSEIFLAR